MTEQFYFAEKSQLLTQAQLLAFEHAKSSLKIGIPKETTLQENRVAHIVHDPKSVYECDIILKVAPPTQEELQFYRPNQILISPLHLPMISADYIQLLRQKRVTSLAMEYMQSDDNSFPIVRIMSEIAGLAVVHTAAELLSDSKNGKGILLGGISGVPPAKVVILGAGVVAEYATRAALVLRYVYLMIKSIG